MAYAMNQTYELWPRSNYWFRLVFGPGRYSPWRSTGMNRRKDAEEFVRKQDPDTLDLEDELVRIGQEQQRRRIMEVFESGALPVTPAEVPTLPEAFELFAESAIKDIWGGDYVHYCANMLAAMSELGMGEIQGVQFQHVSVGERAYIDVVHRWSRPKQCLLEPRGGQSRRVWLSPRVSKWVDLVMKHAAYQSPEALVFQCDADHRCRHDLQEQGGKVPIAHDWIGEKLHRAFWKIGVDASRRGIVFDSWRKLLPSFDGLLHPAPEKRSA